MWQQANGRIASTPDTTPGALGGRLDDGGLEAEAERVGSAVGVGARPSRDSLVREARAFMARERVRPSAIFIVTDRITAYDGAFRARGSWALHDDCPHAPGFVFDGGVGVEAWSALARPTPPRSCAAAPTTPGGRRSARLAAARGPDPRRPLRRLARPRPPPRPRPHARHVPGHRARHARDRGAEHAGGGAVSPRPLELARPHRVRRRHRRQRRGADGHPRPEMRMQLEVVPGASPPPGHVVGLNQTMHHSTRVGIYSDDTGREQARYTFQLGAMMDQDTFTGALTPPWQPTATSRRSRPRW
ncbi:MAG: hypothetical protein U1F43_13610 [Myxococcota bacterium]